ncbi:hypothetical protein OsI_19788 [Oryza sativa Indica Group]|uniref:DDE Tnp4 domain-containing protein n=1 Tax=Oryza sativa subsp. indica TaxID=39946 RepID=B8AXS7_ORYSI|nr:hypothetical protein OsI_19788 [Oryza sativa Indica Group]
MVVFRETVNNADHFPHPPPCNYYLVDSGYPLREGYMSPYRKTRYHLKQLDTKGPENLHEIFNYQHSCLRNVVERSFGVLKDRLQGSGVLHAKIDGDYYQAFDMEDWHVCWDGYGFLGKLARDYVTFMILSHWNTMFLNANDAGARTSAKRQRPISSSSGEPARQPA